MKNFIFFVIFIIFFTIIISVATVECYGFDSGAGGLSYGFNSPLSFGNFIPVNSVDFSYYGGYGYAVIGNYIIGGFGFAVLGYEIYTEGIGLAGGFGGLISGKKIFNGYLLDVDILLWLGLGGVAPDVAEGYFSFYVELTLDFSIKITYWMELAFYGGYQIMGNLIPGIPYSSFKNNTFVFGFRLAFGS